MNNFKCDAISLLKIVCIYNYYSLLLLVFTCGSISCFTTISSLVIPPWTFPQFYCSQWLALIRMCEIRHSTWRYRSSVAGVFLSLDWLQKVLAAGKEKVTWDLLYGVPLCSLGAILCGYKSLKWTPIVSRCGLSSACVWPSDLYHKTTWCFCLCLGQSLTAVVN